MSEFDCEEVVNNFSKACTWLSNAIDKERQIPESDLSYFSRMVIFSLRNDIFFEVDSFEDLSLSINKYCHYKLTSDTNLRRRFSYVRLYQMVILLRQGIKNATDEQYVSSLVETHVYDNELINVIKKSPGITFKELRDLLSILPDDLAKRLTILEEQRFLISRREGECRCYVLSNLGYILHRKLKNVIVQG